VVIAAGTRVAKPDGIPFDGQTVFTSDDILRLDCIPQSLTVIGGGVIGCEYACMFATLGVRVTLVDKHDSLLSFVDREIVDALIYHMRQQRVTFRLCESVKTIEPFDTTRGKQVRITLESGKEIVTDKALYSIGRTGATDSLDLAAIGLKPDSRGRLKVNKQYQTDVPNVYAVGDVIGFPSLASTLNGAGTFSRLSRLPD
jgi:NAD(P) transhydrogenase